MKYVCTGATLKCTMGTANSSLIATPKNVSLTGKDQANIADYVSMVNVLPFGNCRSLAYPPTKLVHCISNYLYQQPSI